jgi:hypothetical protein
VPSDIDEQSDIQLSDLVCEEFVKDCNRDLEWRNREDKLTRGQLKGVASAAVSCVSIYHVPVGSLLVNIPKLRSTHDVIGKLRELKKAVAAEKWVDDIDYIIARKQAKMKKAGASIVCGAGVTVYHLGKSAYKRSKGTLGAHRKEVATRLLKGLKSEDSGARSIVLALFHDSEKAQTIALQLKCADEDLAVKVLMGKISSST